VIDDNDLWMPRSAIATSRCPQRHVGLPGRERDPDRQAPLPRAAGQPSPAARKNLRRSFIGLIPGRLTLDPAELGL
jgi:hypothetical protein